MADSLFYNALGPLTLQNYTGTHERIRDPIMALSGRYLSHSSFQGPGMLVEDKEQSVRQRLATRKPSSRHCRATVHMNSLWGVTACTSPTWPRKVSYKFCPWHRSYWQVIAARRGRANFLQECAPRRLDHSSGETHPRTFGKNKLDTMVKNKWIHDWVGRKEDQSGRNWRGAST